VVIYQHGVDREAIQDSQRSTSSYVAPSAVLKLLLLLLELLSPGRSDFDVGTITVDALFDTQASDLFVAIKDPVAVAAKSLNEFEEL